MQLQLRRTTPTAGEVSICTYNEAMTMLTQREQVFSTSLR